LRETLVPPAFVLEAIGFHIHEVPLIAPHAREPSSRFQGRIGGHRLIWVFREPSGQLPKTGSRASLERSEGFLLDSVSKDWDHPIPAGFGVSRCAEKPFPESPELIPAEFGQGRQTRGDMVAKKIK
jgi:hypothetical protein